MHTWDAEQLTRVSRGACLVLICDQARTGVHCPGLRRWSDLSKSIESMTAEIEQPLRD
jgi:hypothetical protein